MDLTDLRRKLEDARQSYEWLRLRLRLLTTEPPHPPVDMRRGRRAAANAEVRREAGIGVDGPDERREESRHRAIARMSRVVRSCENCASDHANTAARATIQR
jgi:hypothetical protein